MSNKVNLIKDGNCYYLTQSLLGMNLYQRTKAIQKFVEQETKVLENCVDKEIREIFQKNGITIESTEKDYLENAFWRLRTKGVVIQIDDFYKNTKFSDCVLIGTTKSNITVWLEKEELLQCAIEIKEVSL